MSFVVIIPARYAASRLPGKPLLEIAGKPMLQHTYERALESRCEKVYIATDDERIRLAAEEFGAQVFMTAQEHRSGTDRIHEVADRLELAEHAIVVNVQADEPLLPPAAIDQVAANLQQRPEAGMATLCEVISAQEEVVDPHAVKVVRDKQGYALYFSRATIPYQASASAKNCLRHVGIYAYRVGLLRQFVSWPPAELEIAEKLEQLRALGNGVRIHTDVALQSIPPGVDTEHDLETVRSFLARSGEQG